MEGRAGSNCRETGGSVNEAMSSGTNILSEPSTSSWQPPTWQIEEVAAATSESLAQKYGTTAEGDDVVLECEKKNQENIHKEFQSPFVSRTAKRGSGKFEMDIPIEMPDNIMESDSDDGDMETAIVGGQKNMEMTETINKTTEITSNESGSGYVLGVQPNPIKRQPDKSLVRMSRYTWKLPKPIMPNQDEIDVESISTPTINTPVNQQCDDEEECQGIVKHDKPLKKLVMDYEVSAQAEWTEETTPLGPPPMQQPVAIRNIRNEGVSKLIVVEEKQLDAYNKQQKVINDWVRKNISKQTTIKLQLAMKVLVQVCHGQGPVWRRGRVEDKPFGLFIYLIDLMMIAPIQQCKSNVMAMPDHIDAMPIMTIKVFLSNTKEELRNFPRTHSPKTHSVLLIYVEEEYPLEKEMRVWRAHIKLPAKPGPKPKADKLKGLGPKSKVILK